jgi:hypothetical protein
VDVRNILASEQRKILDGCRIVFSRIFPVGEANPHLHPLWQTAEQFGASCTNQIDDQVTHVVANSLGTDKVYFDFETFTLLYGSASPCAHFILFDGCIKQKTDTCKIIITVNNCKYMLYDNLNTASIQCIC